jgi:hypothetical protein
LRKEPVGVFLTEKEESIYIFLIEVFYDISLGMAEAREAQ